MPVIEKITIKGFRSIRCIEDLKLTRLNLLIGANGSGKSNFIEVFTLLDALRKGKLKDYAGTNGGANRLLHFGSKNTKRLFLRVHFNNLGNQYEIEMSPTSSDGLHPLKETAGFWNKLVYLKPYKGPVAMFSGEAGIGAVRDKYKVPWYVKEHLNVKEHLDCWRKYHFHDTGFHSPMKKNSELHDNHFLRPDGSNLASFLYLIREKHSDSYKQIRNAIRNVAPFFDDFDLKPMKMNENMIRLEWKSEGSDEMFDASALSDGTLRFMALCTLLLQPCHLQPLVIIMDEPELGLHPFAVEFLAGLIRRASTEAQIILATQSMHLLDCFNPEDVIVADRVDKSTKLHRLDPEELKEWLEDYSLGELWNQNYLGGRPRPEDFRHWSHQ